MWYAPSGRFTGLHWRTEGRTWFFGIRPVCMRGMHVSGPQQSPRCSMGPLREEIISIRAPTAELLQTEPMCSTTYTQRKTPRAACRRRGFQPDFDVQAQSNLVLHATTQVVRCRGNSAGYSSEFGFWNRDSLQTALFAAHSSTPHSDRIPTMVRTEGVGRILTFHGSKLWSKGV